jgi:hypothetical protein
VGCTRQGELVRTDPQWTAPARRLKES